MGRRGARHKTLSALPRAARAANQGTARRRSALAPEPPGCEPCGVDDKAFSDGHRMDDQDVLRVKLEVLRREHRDLDEAVRALQEGGRVDMLTLQRLKRKKLALKDRIADIEDRLLPDIIA